MKKQFEALLMTLAYQRLNELSIAMAQLDQATQMTKDPGEKEFLSTQRGQMAYMHKELSEATSEAAKAAETP